MSPAETRVVNAHNAKYDVLIDRTTIFGNPFQVKNWGREVCIQKFEAYFYKRIEEDFPWREAVFGLRGKILGCHCKPLHCHGDVYADYLNTYEQVEKLKVQAKLQDALDRINILATDHGWYVPELQGEMYSMLSEINHPDAAEILAAAGEDRDYDFIEAVDKYLRGT